MTEVVTTPDEAANAARRLLEETIEKKVDAVRAVVLAARATAIARASLAESLSQHARSWADALAAGWTEKELKAAGVSRPELERVRAPRTRRSGASETGSAGQ